MVVILTPCRFRFGHLKKKFARCFVIYVVVGCIDVITITDMIVRIIEILLSDF